MKKRQILIKIGKYRIWKHLVHCFPAADLMTLKETTYTQQGSEIKTTLSFKLQTADFEKHTKILLESLRRPFRAAGSSPMFGCMNFASFIMLVTSSRPSFLIFQFLSPILDTSSAVILSLQEKYR